MGVGVGFEVAAESAGGIAGGFEAHFLGVEVEGDDTGDDDDEGDEEFHPGGEHDTALALGEGGGAERALGDVLVEAPVVEVGDPYAEEEGGPGEDGVGGGKEHGHAGFIEVPEALDTAGVGVEGVDDDCAAEGVGDGGGFRGGAELGEGEEHDDGAADDEGATLEEVGPGAGFEAAGGDIDHGDEADDE